MNPLAKIRPTVPVALSKRFASRLVKRDDLKLFKDINKHAKDGTWCSINNQPETYLFFKKPGVDTAPAFASYKVLLGKPKYWRDTIPEGYDITLVVRAVSFFIGVHLVYVFYNALVPQEYRYKFQEYEANIKHHLEDHHGHDEHHH